MLTRRSFGKLSLGAITALAARNLFAATGKPLGLQLYTIRNEAEKDLPGVLKAIHEIGYTEVEPYWNIYNHPAKELKKSLADNGLTAPSGHFDYDKVATSFDYAQELGVKYMICPILDESLWNSLDSYKKVAENFNKWGAEAQKRGMKFGFHNHNYEFRKFGEHTGLEILMTETDPKLVQLEMDCYWVTQAGADPVTLMDRYKNRVRMLHIKDRKAGFATSQELNDAAQHFAEVGTGSIDWAPIIEKAKAIGVKHFFVEQDVIEGDPLKSVKISYEHARKLL